mmetsp:Transcript_99362/g.320451  ORF Transcript_99362/g.320451 Transcript_99362/m.320451 type:complete len:555 (+) Transcript_99362:64-1728(+)
MVVIEETDGSSDPFEKAEAHRKQGNELLSKGDYADACKCYDEGLLALVRVGTEQATEVRQALHLNASLAHLRRGNLASAVDHATGALATDPSNVKALYRRGLARARLAEHPGHDAEVALARSDLEKALALEPQNAEVRSQLQRLRAAARAEQKELNKSQKESFKGIFASDKPLYQDTSAASEPAPILHSGAGGADHELVLSAQGLGFHYERSEPILTGLDLELRAGWCVALFGNNAAGKTTLARILSHKLTPRKGFVVHHSKGGGTPSSTAGASLATSALATAILAVVAAAAVAAALGKNAQKLPAQMVWWQWAALAVALLSLTAAINSLLERRAAARQRRTVMHVTSETQDKEDIPDRKTIEKAIGENLPRSMKASERRERVIAMLRAGGFQMYNQATGEPVGTPEDYVRDGLRFGHLSGGQKHLIYVLRCFAARPEVLLCDELLGGLDAWRQPRVLHMLRRLKEAGTALLYIGTELHQLRLAADSIGFLHKGKICELGPTEEVLDFPRHPATKDYIQQYRGLPGGRVIGGKLAENYTGLAGDKDLEGPWLSK